MSAEDAANIRTAVRDIVDSFARGRIVAWGKSVVFLMRLVDDADESDDPLIVAARAYIATEREPRVHYVVDEDSTAHDEQLQRSRDAWECLVIEAHKEPM